MVLSAGQAKLNLYRVVALSSSEAEYIALSMATQEATWMQKLLNDLQACVSPFKIMEDSATSTVHVFKG